MKAFAGNIFGSPWAIYNEDGSLYKAFGSNGFQSVKQIPSREPGKVCLQLSDGRVLSIQPGGGQIQTRVNGSDGAWEQFTVTGTVCAITPTDDSYVFALVPA